MRWMIVVFYFFWEGVGLMTVRRFAKLNACLGSTSLLMLIRRNGIGCIVLRMM